MRTFAVALPTRGLVHSRCIESVLRTAHRATSVQPAGEDWLHFAHGLPIPESHNAAAELAMQTGADLILFVEDDNVLPPDALERLVATMDDTGAGVAAINYPVGTVGTRWTSIYHENGVALFSGLGMTLVRREVLEAIGRPWFSLDRWYGRICEACGRVKGRCPERSCRNELCRRPCGCQGEGSELRLIDHPFPTGTGGVDVAFSIRVREAGFTIAEVPRLVGAQLRITRPGAASGSGDNLHPHVVERWEVIDDRGVHVVPPEATPVFVEWWETIDADQKEFRVNDFNRFDKRAERARWASVFQREKWISRFWIGATPYGGEYDPMHDRRVTLARDTFDYPRRVLELGALEGGHTVAISRWADTVTAVEGRPDNVRKARMVLEMFDAANARIVEGNLETMDLGELGEFDLVFSVGVLYHLPDPLKLIARMADAAPDLFLWTHHSPNGDRMTYQEHGLGDPLSGMSETSTWLPRGELLDELHDRYDHVEVLDEEDTPAGPAITIAARQRRRPTKRALPANKRIRPENKAARA